MQTRLRHLLIATTAALALLPASANAGTIDVDGDKIVVTAGSVENTLTLSQDEPGKLSISDSSEPYSFPNGPCSQLGPEYPVICAMPATVEAHLGEGDDSLVVFPGLDQSVRVLGLGEEGKDELRAIDAPGDITYDGGAGDDVLTSENGADTLLGGAGNDTITGNNGADELRGGEGDDLLRGDGGDGAADVLDGGAGVDTVDDWGTAFDAPLVNVTLDGQANDGGPGEGDDVRDVERLETYVAGTFVMSDGPDRVSNFPGADAPASTIDGRGGDDVLTGGRSQHTIDGGPGNDRVEGGWGHDTLTGGPGQDQIFGDATSGNCGGSGQSCTVPFGNDVIDARDGEADQVDCGVGEDKAVVDAIDTVAACETVETSGGSGGGGAGGGGGNSGGGTPVAPSGGAKLSLAAKTKLAKALRSGLRIRLTGLPAGTVKVKAKSGGKLVASANARVGADGTATATLRFTRTARKALGRKRSARLTVTAGSARLALTLKR